MAKDKPTRVRVYKYGLQSPTQNVKLVDQQIRLAHQYRNALCELERNRRAMQDELYELRRDIDEPFYDEPANGIRRVLLNEVQTWIYGVFRERGLFWGTCLLVKKHTELWTRPTFPGGPLPDPPTFARYTTGDGTIGVQIQGGIAPSALATDTRVRLVPQALQTTNTHDRHGRLRTSTHKLYELWLRVGSNGRAPIWAVWPVKIHRPLPAHARILWVTVSRKYEGLRARWTVSFTVDEDATSTRTGESAIAIDIGWRSLTSLRAASWFDGKNRGDVVIPKAGERSGIVSGLKKSDDLRSIRRQRRNQLQDQLGAWFAQNSATLPTWLASEASHFRLWKSARRFVRLYWTWTAQRFANDTAGYAILAAWFAKERHLYDWEVAQRRKTLGRRQEQYNTWAAHVARTYDHIVIERFDLTAFARRTSTEDGAAKPRRKNRSAVAPSALRNALRRAAQTHGATIHEVDPAYTTMDCHACGQRESWDQENELQHTCSACGATWDQDFNAAVNLLTRWRAQSSTNSTPAEQTRPVGGRWQRRKQHRSQPPAQADESTP